MDDYLKGLAGVNMLLLFAVHQVQGFRHLHLVYLCSEFNRILLVVQKHPDFVTLVDKLIGSQSATGLLCRQNQMAIIETELVLM